MGKKIVSLWVEIHHTDSELTPNELKYAALNAVTEYAAETNGTVIVIRTNAFQEPEPEPGGSDEGSNPIPTDGDSNGGDG